MNCMWCETEDIRESVKDCYWVYAGWESGGSDFGSPRYRMLQLPYLRFGEHRAANRRDPILA